ncbi:MAG: hypothetical protein ACPL7R_07990, partial [Anaerolineae bacterium]
MLRWLIPDSRRSDITGADLARECEPLLSWDIWNKMVERGYQPRLPDPGSPARLQVIVVVDALDGQDTVPPLDQMLGEARLALERRAELSPALIWLGERPGSLSQGLDKCWPRIRLEQWAVGGIKVDRAKVLEAVEHLVVALVTSDLVRAMDSFLKREAVEWVVMGASALLVNMRAEEYVREALLRDILEALVKPVPDVDRPRLVEEVRKRAQRVREALVEEGVAALKEVGWEAAASGLAIQECSLKDRGLLEAAFGPYQYAMATEKVTWKRWLQHLVASVSALARPFAPDVVSGLGPMLRAHYRQVGETVGLWYGEKPRGVAPRIRSELDSLQVFLGAFLDRGLPARSKSGGTPVPWVRERPLPTGVPAAILAVLAMESQFADGVDLEDTRGPSRQPVRPVPMMDGVYLDAAGVTDADIVQGAMRRYMHLSRTLASPWGVLLNLLPAWFVAALVLQSVWRWSEIKSLAIGGLALLVIGIAEMAYWWLLRARGLLLACQRHSLHRIGTRVLA